MDPNPDSFIKVSKASIPKAVAGKISHSTRAGLPPTCLCVGPACVNQAVKAISIARTFLSRDGYDVSFQPAFRDFNRHKANLALRVIAVKPKTPLPSEDEDELSISRTSKPNVVAGAICARIRDGKRVSITAIGIDAVANAVLAIGSSRVFLVENHLDVRAMPEFIVINKADKEMNALRFHLVAETFDEEHRFPLLVTSNPPGVHAFGQGSPSTVE
uniref:Uncharacterized protein n=1 Tax=Polytomella parva TaxID=51329 RepID=A0A7S0UM43_9CHLO|mmetsp:Transcript_10658/g.19464  ORF Transcript_10658/g.19464 Transcript_10658/m.19464 type:complete len:216 (+) Transcript_10658:179-826(+)|eukprot:CAMPEP_0175060734 /NCGR_PEP_ID=MMETSP0052_2-20121109/13195_1 /TAXON_ID=51329 ORGANISM="Polytomella parva, Strain SAG 63-3" /NCGR_SAMPLE_ID=MMETSP0052_2 /ASSEMBLY_ACC=CAM_ASM_000194 /LENGTH=215 /DNA_ID=CAMNT_0016326513 /DNA_START=168 /DNA_END=815 /DNA_ORIENTATION=-